jgi:hypothetical protein
MRSLGIEYAGIGRGTGPLNADLDAKQRTRQPKLDW